MADEARVRKVQERILQTVASMIGRQVKDPRLALVTITDVRVTGDLQHASIFYTVLGDDEQREKAARAFASAPVRHVDTSTVEPDEDDVDDGEEMRLVRSMPVR